MDKSVAILEAPRIIMNTQYVKISVLAKEQDTLWCSTASATCQVLIKQEICLYGMVLS